MRLLFISCNKYVIVNTKIAKCCKMLENKNECQWHNKMNNSILTHFLQLGNDKLAFQGTKIKLYIIVEDVLHTFDSNKGRVQNKDILRTF